MSELRRLWPLPWIVAGLAVLGTVYRLPARLDELRLPPPLSDRETDSAVLFDALVKAGEIAFVSPDSMRLTEPSGDDRLGRSVTSSKAGEAIRNEIRHWNEQHRLAAIRDNRAIARDRGLAAGGPLMIAARTLQPAWAASLTPRDVRSTLSFPLQTGGQVLTELGMVAWPLRPGMSDWLAAPVPTSSGIVTFTSELPPGLTRLGVDVVGRVLGVRFGDAGADADLGDRRAYERCSRTTSRKLPPVCPASADPDLAHLDLRPPPDAQRITIRVEPVELPIADLPHQPDNSRIGLYPPSPQEQGIPCGRDAENKVRACVLRWGQETKRPGVAAWRAKAPFAVEAADGTLLLEGRVSEPNAEVEVAPTAEARALGLLPILGLGPSDWGGLAAWLAWRRDGDEPLKVVLSIRPDWQKVALEVLGRADRLAGGGASDPRRDQRHGAVVLLDATTGAILAAASTPLPQLGLNEWDLHAIEDWNPQVSPLATRTWRNADENSAPGSAWKLISSIALIDIASGAYPELGEPVRAFAEQAILGYAKQDLASKFGAPPEAGTKAKPYMVRSPSGEPLGSIRNALDDEGLRSAVFKENESRCPNETSQAAKIGLCEALIESINAWFVHALVWTDGQQIDQRQSKATGLAIQAAARRLLGPDIYEKRGAREQDIGRGPEDLLVPLACLGRPQPCSPDARRSGGRGSRGLAERSGMSVTGEMAARGGPLFKLAQNSFGQGVQTTPLQVATLYAALSARHAVRPYLIESMALSGRPVPFARQPIEAGKTLFVAPEKGDRYWHYLERGLAGVSGPAGSTNPGIGTARVMRAFNTKERPTRLLSKTGTAEIQAEGRDQAGNPRNEEFKTAWYAGLLRDVQLKAGNRPQTLDLAFACMVTHSSRFGGDVCGPIMRDVLSAIDGRR